MFKLLALSQRRKVRLAHGHPLLQRSFQANPMLALKFAEVSVLADPRWIVRIADVDRVVAPVGERKRDSVRVATWSK